MKKDFDYYVSLPYRIEIEPSPEGGYGVWIPDLPGCISQGETVEDAVQMIEDAKRCWIECAIEKNHNIPEPKTEIKTTGEYSGRFIARVPKSVHRDLAIKAKDEGVSLNQLVLALIASGLGKSASVSK